jgi:hypothetical protein
MCSIGVLRELLNGYTVLSQVGRWVKVSGVGTATGQWYRGRERQEKNAKKKANPPEKKHQEKTKKLKEENQKKPTGQMAKPDNQPVPRQPDGTQTINQSK